MKFSTKNNIRLLISFGFMIFLIYEIGCAAPISTPAPGYICPDSETFINYQSAVPFTIVLPTDFPEDTGPCITSMDSPLKNPKYGSTIIKIVYLDKRISKYMVIIEENRISIAEGGSGATFLKFGKVTVVEQPTSSTSIEYSYYVGL